ncbi:DUF4148 domain-containing protein [Burkholderia gladioli]|uniref:DUF4148 domain-containing protein n=1 Tax=Burkholderia gladioli TaxID=28095 RepID=UPI000AC83AA8
MEARRALVADAIITKLSCCADVDFVIERSGLPQAAVARMIAWLGRLSMCEARPGPTVHQSFGGMTMSKSTRWFAAACAACAASLALSAPAFAKVDNNGLTRDEVRMQLIDAQRAGWVPSSDADYPPSAATVARNRELYAIAHHADAEPGMRTAAVDAAP